MRRYAGPFSMYFTLIMIIVLSLMCLVLQQGKAAAAPATPTIVAPAYGTITSIDPVLQGSPFSGSAHKATQWQIATTSDFNQSIVWERIAPGPEIQTVATGLEANTVYWVRVCYEDNSDIWSSFSDPSFFMTATPIWYFAEGCTDGGMETWVLVQNPCDADAKVEVDFITDKGLVAGPRDTIPPFSRRSYNAGSYVTSYNVSTRIITTQGAVVCERAMYGNNRSWGHDSIGATSLDGSWHFAEGCTDGGMETWLLVQNPNNYDVSFRIYLITDEGSFLRPGLDYCRIPANSRQSFNIGDYMQSYNIAISLVIDGQIFNGGDPTGEGVICERAMYGNNRQWAHDSIGALAPKPVWFFAEGCTDGGMETWLLIQNMSMCAQNVGVCLMDETGPIGYITGTMPADSRCSINLGEYTTSYSIASSIFVIDGNGQFMNNACLVCEESMYDISKTWGQNSIGAPLPGPVWTLPEGSSMGGMETWILVQNPNDESALVNISFMTEKGLVEPPELQGISMNAFSRQSFNVGNYVNSYDVSAGVTSNKPVVCQRSMYGPDHVWAHNSVGYPLGLGYPYAPKATSAGYAGAESASSSFNTMGIDDFRAVFPLLP